MEAREGSLCAVDSTGGRNTVIEPVRRRFVVSCFPEPFVQLAGHMRQVGTGMLT